MNVFIHQNNLQIKRRDAFQLVQEEVYKNISQRFIAMLSSPGVIMNLIGDGLSDHTSLKVERVDGQPGQIRIRKGYAVITNSNPEDHDLIVLKEDTIIILADTSIGAAFTGTAYVYIAHQEDMVASGKEVYLPGVLSGVDHIFLLKEDSSIITVGSAYDADKILLAKIDLDNSAMAFDDSTLHIDEPITRPYIDSDDLEVTIQEATMGTGVPSAGTLLAGEEEIEYDGFAAKIITLTTRGANDTIATIHRNADTLIASPIIDIRQSNAAKISTNYIGFIQRLSNGIIDFNDGSGDRFLRTMRVPDIPNTPELIEDNFTLIWLNRQTTGGNVSKAMTEKINKVKSLNGRMKNLTSNIATARADLANAEAEEAVEINARIAEDQLELAQVRSEVAEASSELDAYSAVIGTGDRKYVAACIVDQPALKDNEQIIRYEASIDYLPIKASAIDKMSNITSQIFSTTLMLDGINEYGDSVYTYVSQPEAIYRTILIPIRSNEKVKVRVRSITEHFMVSDWSDYVEFAFDDLESSDIRLAMDLDALQREQNPFLNGVITQETILMLQEMQKNFMDAMTEMRALVSDIANIKSDIVSIIERLVAAEAAIAELQSQGSGFAIAIENIENQQQQD